MQTLKNRWQSGYRVALLLGAAVCR